MDKVLRALQTILLNQNITGVKKIIYGDPIKIPEDDMPCITLNPVSTEYINRGNEYDEKHHAVDIKLVYNAKAIFQKTYASSTKPTVHAIEEAIGITEKTNASLETQSDSIMGVLRKNQTLSVLGVKSADAIYTSNITYQTKDDRAFPSYEVTLSILVVQIANR